MRIVYLDADFGSATGETGPRSFAFARRLRANGHEVTILTSDRCVDWGERHGRIIRFETDGVPVVAVRVGLGRASTNAGRIWHHLLFAVLSSWALLRTLSADVLYVTSPPLSSVVPALLMRWFRHVPFVLEVREIWPEVPRGMDLIRSRVLFYLLRQLALVAYRSASRVVALTEPALQHIQADIPLMNKLVRIGACCDVDLFAQGDGSRWREKYGWAGKFVSLHAGPMVASAGLEAILRVADVLREDEQFVFWLIGSGEHRRELERNIRDRELRNVMLSPPVDRRELPDILAAADLCLLTVRRYRVLEQSSNDRLFDYLAAGKPILLNYGGWQRDLIEQHGAGLGTTLGEHGEFFEHICRLCDRPALREQMGRSARRLAETLCHPDPWAARLEEVLREAAKG